VKKFKIVKFFKGGSTIYYAKMSVRNKIKRNCWQHQLEEWGEGTDGGHAYGYRIEANKITSVPRDLDTNRILEFNPDYLAKIKTKVKKL